MWYKVDWEHMDMCTRWTGITLTMDMGYNMEREQVDMGYKVDMGNVVMGYKVHGSTLTLGTM